MMSESSTVYIVDDDPAVRESLTMLLEHDGFQVQTFPSAEHFLETCKGMCSGCGIVDIRMPGMDGLELQRALTDQGIALPLIILTGHGDIPSSVRAIKAGAVNFLTKPVKVDELRESIRLAFEQNDQLQRRNHLSRRLAALTPREREVLNLAIAGHSNKEIARLLNISHRTVEIHKGKIYQKMHTSSLVEIAQMVNELMNVH